MADDTRQGPYLFQTFALLHRRGTNLVDSRYGRVNLDRYPGKMPKRHTNNELALGQCNALARHKDRA